jgi:hypothetical protein
VHCNIIIQYKPIKPKLKLYYKLYDTYYVLHIIYIILYNYVKDYKPKLRI